MKILIANDNMGAHYYERLGLVRAFNACGHSATLWNISQTPTNDVFDTIEPDIFIGQTYNLTPTIINAIKERPHLKVICKASDWGNLDTSAYPILRSNPQEQDTICKLYEETGQPNYLTIYYHPDYIEQTHGLWPIPVKSQLLASDVLMYTNGQSRPEFECDIAFVGGHWGYKGQVIDRYLIPLCYGNKYRIKIYGNKSWCVAQYCGFIPDEVVKDALSSAIICPNLSEPHAQDFGFDINERCFKLASNKCFIISDYVEGLEKLYGDSIVYAKNSEEFEAYISHYIQNPELCQSFVDKAFDITINNHTYFHRVAEIFTNLGYVDLASLTLQQYKLMKAKHIC